MKRKSLLIFLAVFAVFVLCLFSSFSVFEVSGSSMSPTLKNGDKIVVSKLSYILKQPERGDLVLISEGSEKWVKRIIGVAGETLSVKDGNVFINEQQISESYIKGSHTYGNQNVVLGNDQYFVIGDNREPNQSTDSRIYGPIGKEKILGRVSYIMAGGLKELKKETYTFK